MRQFDYSVRQDPGRVEEHVYRCRFCRYEIVLLTRTDVVRVVAELQEHCLAHCLRPEG